MKKIILLAIFLIGVIFASAQTTPTAVTPDGYLNKEYYRYLFGTTADTLTNADTTTFVLRVKPNQTQDFTIKLYLDHVSGTAADSLVMFSSIDGVNYQTTTDTLIAAAVTADIMDTDVITLSDYNYPYLKFQLIQSGTAVTVPKVYIYSKKN